MKNQKKIDEILEKYRNKKGNLIPVLQQVQDVEGYLSKDVMKYVSEQIGTRVAEIYGVATFYSMFRLKPQGENIVRVCLGTACHVGGAKQITEAIKNELKLEGEEDTTPDLKFTVMEVACLGCCSLAPVIMINQDTFGKLTPQSVRKILKEYN